MRVGNDVYCAVVCGIVRFLFPVRFLFTPRAAVIISRRPRTNPPCSHGARAPRVPTAAFIQFLAAISSPESVGMNVCGVPLKYFSLCMLVVQTTAAVVLTRWSKLRLVENGGADYKPYYSTALVVTQEFTKLVCSLALVYFVDMAPARSSGTEEKDADSGGGAKASDAAAGGRSGATGDGAPPSVTSVAPSTDSAGGVPPTAAADHHHGHHHHHQATGNSSLWQRLLARNKKVRSYLALLYSENLLHPMETCKLLVPAALYTLQNNLVYVALANLESTTFQVGYQSKVVTTALLSVLILKRSLSSVKWIALVVLMTGIILTQATNTTEGKAKAASGNAMIGMASVATSSFSSAFAGVYFEKILKGSQSSLWMRNAQLAFFSVVLGLIGMAATDGLFINVFQGFNALVWLIIAVQAVGGLIVAVVIKYADNILKGFATALSILLCGAVSSYMFAFEPDGVFVLGACLVILATFMYSMPDSTFGSTLLWWQKLPPASGASMVVTGARNDGPVSSSSSSSVRPAADGSSGQSLVS